MIITIIFLFQLADTVFDYVIIILIFFFSSSIYNCILACSSAVDHLLSVESFTQALGEFWGGA